VSSLPFLAPIFLRKAREYTSKYSGGSGNGYGSSGNGGRTRGKSNEGYMLGSISSKRKGTFASAKATNHDTGSEENILEIPKDRGIVKSITYTVHVDKDPIPGLGWTRGPRGAG
jgi:hypothetical protein